MLIKLEAYECATFPSLKIILEFKWINQKQQLTRKKKYPHTFKDVLEIYEPIKFGGYLFWDILYQIISS